VLGLLGIQIMGAAVLHEGIVADNNSLQGH
jgi:hypothetical protein